MPTLIATPFATNGVKNEIPETAGAQPQNATMSDGFPDITQTPIAEGGIPPERADFNGILYTLSDNISHINKGLGFGFDLEYATKIGGYPLHAELVLNDGTRVTSLIPSNMNNPNTDLTGWRKGVPASNVTDESGLSQQEINNKRFEGVDSVLELSSFKPKSNGQIIYLKSYHAGKATGWGYLEYDQNATSTANDVTTFSAFGGGLWRRQLKDQKEIYAVDGGVLFDNATDNTVAFRRICAMLPSEATLKLSIGTARTSHFELPQFGCRISGAELTHSTIKLLLKTDYIGWKEYNFFKNFRVIGTGVYESDSYLFKDTRPNKDTKADCDIFWENCYFSEAEYVTDGFGRGFKFDNCQDYNIRYAWVKVDFPPNFIPNGTDNDTLETGFRGFVFTNNRRHYSPAYFLWNTGYNAQNLQGVQITNTQLEGGGRFVVGYMRDAVITGTCGYHRNANWKYFELTGGENISITGNVFAKMRGNATNSDAFLTSVGAIKDLTISGNTFDGVHKEIVRLAHSSQQSADIVISLNTYKNCFNSGDPIFNITAGSVKNLTVRERLTAPNSTWLAAKRTSGLAVYKHSIDVIADGSPFVHNFARGESLGSVRKQGVYSGDGATKTIVCGYEPMMLKITGSDGTTCLLPQGTNVMANGVSLGTNQDFIVSGNANKIGATYFWETE